eukprot:m.455323 g.455323  ORF g.455323 m.455323 type:complete len:196 (+) comp20852_c0_seq1:129-716(+)
MEPGEVVCVGYRLASKSAVESGDGTYIRDGYVHASIVGRRVLTDAPGGGKPVLSVVSRNQLRVPRVGATVGCKITSISPQFAKATILLLANDSGDTVPLADGFRGMIRVQDIRATEKDKVVVYECFRPGDVVLAKVISLGDAKSYYLSTAEDSLGVVYAESEFGAPLLPVSWTQVEDGETGVVQTRKVARPSSLS